MQFLSIIVTTFLLSNFYTVQSQVQNAIRISFNASGSCNNAEYAAVLACLETTYTSRRNRNLRMSSSGTNETKTIPVSRELTSGYPPICEQKCAGFLPGRCVTSSDLNNKCRGYRKDRDLAHTERELNPSCDNLLAAAHTCLDNLRSPFNFTVSSTCKSMIGPRWTRQTECFERLKFGTVSGARLWSITDMYGSNNYVMKERLPTSGYTMCKSQKFNLEAINDPCVRGARMVFTNQFGQIVFNRTEYYRPYTGFGDDSGLLYGGSLNASGTYTFTIIPDNDTSRQKSFSFRLLDC